MQAPTGFHRTKALFAAHDKKHAMRDVAVALHEHVITTGDNCPKLCTLVVMYAIYIGPPSCGDSYVLCAFYFGLLHVGAAAASMCRRMPSLS